MSNKYQAVAQLLLATKAQIAVLLSDPDDELHRLKLDQALQFNADYIVMVTGSGDTHETKTTVLGPAKTIGGKPIGKERKFTDADLVPSDDKVYNLKMQVEDAIPYFGPEANSAGILANIPDLVIRGVAKKAGLKEVSKDNPKEITVEFIDEILQALHPKKENTPELSEEEKQALADHLAKANVGSVAPVIPIETTPQPDQLPDIVTSSGEPGIETKTVTKETQTPNPETTPQIEEPQPAKTAEAEYVKATDINQLKAEKKKK